MVNFPLPDDFKFFGNYYQDYYNKALEIAKESPCVRAKYGAVIIGVQENGEVGWNSSFNKRISRCCSGPICVRDRYGTKNGERPEYGAEIHAEQSVLILQRGTARDLMFFLAGFNRQGKEMMVPTVFPCHVCALMIADAGFKYVWMKTEENVIEPISIYDIIEHREAEWQIGDNI